MQAAVSTFGRPYWARNCTGRICVSFRALIVEGDVTETRVAVGPELFGPYPDWTLEKLEYFVLNRAKGGGPWKKEIVTNKNVPQNGQQKYHDRNFTGIKDGDVFCVEAHVKGAVPVNGKSTTATELYTTCTTARYAADIQTTIALSQSVFEWSENPTLTVTATFTELRGIMPGTFQAVLLINGVPIEARPTQPFTAGGTVSGVVFQYAGLEPGAHSVSVVAINVLPGDYNLANNVDSKPFQVNVFGQPPTPPPTDTTGGGGGTDTRSSRQYCQEENTCPPRSLEFRASQQFDTTLNMTWERSVRNGEVASLDYTVSNLTFSHDYSTSMNAVWDIDFSYPVDSISLQQVTRDANSNIWHVIDKQDVTTAPALRNLSPNNGPDCHDGGSNQFGFSLCRVFLDGRWQTSLAYNHARAGASSFPDVATATLFFGPDLTNPTPHSVVGTDYQGVGNIQLLGSRMRYAMNVYLPGGKVLQAWAEMEIVTFNLGTGGSRLVFEDTCSAGSLDCDQVVRYTYNGSIWKRGGQAVDNSRH